MISSSKRPLPDNTQQSQHTNIHAPLRAEDIYKYNYLRRRFFLFSKSEWVWPSYSAVRCIITSAVGVWSASQTLFGVRLWSAEWRQIAALSVMFPVFFLSVIMHYFALFCGEASKGFHKFRVLRNCGVAAFVVSHKPTVSIFGVEEHRFVRNVFETNHTALLPKRQSFSQMKFWEAQFWRTSYVWRRRHKTEPVELIYENWQKAVLYVTLFIYLFIYLFIVYLTRPPLLSSGQSFWLQIQRYRVRFPALPDFLSSSGSGTGSTQPREVKWGANWIKSSSSGPENRD